MEMRHRERLFFVGLVIIGLLAPACRDVSESAKTKPEPARVEPIEGTKLSRVILTEEAAQRLDIRTTMVKETGVGGTTFVPYGAVFYATTGDTWTYVASGPLTFVRRAIRVEHFVVDLAVLSDGPPPGSRVVTVGAAELFGIESGIGH
jgi:hypothetical protein